MLCSTALKSLSSSHLSSNVETASIRLQDYPTSPRVVNLILSLRDRLSLHLTPTRCSHPHNRDHCRLYSYQLKFLLLDLLLLTDLASPRLRLQIIVLS